MRLHYTLIFSALLLFVTLPAFSQAQDRVEADGFVRMAFLQKSQFQQDHTLYIALTKDGNIRFDRRPLENSKHYFETSRSDFDSIMISYPSEKKYKSITVNPGRSDYETRRNLGIGAAVGGCLLGIFLGLAL